MISLISDHKGCWINNVGSGYRRNIKISANTVRPFWLYSWVVAVWWAFLRQSRRHDSRRRHRYRVSISIIGDLGGCWNSRVGAGYRRNIKTWAETAGLFWPYSWLVAELWAYLRQSRMHVNRRRHRYRGLQPLIGNLGGRWNSRVGDGYRRNIKTWAETAGPFWPYSWLVAEWWACLRQSRRNVNRRRHRYRGLQPLIGNLWGRWNTRVGAGYRRNIKISAETGGPLWLCSWVVAEWLVSCGSHEGMIIVVAIDNEGWNQLLVTLKDAETLE